MDFILNNLDTIRSIYEVIATVALAYFARKAHKHKDVILKLIEISKDLRITEQEFQEFVDVLKAKFWPNKIVVIGFFVACLLGVSGVSTPANAQLIGTFKAVKFVSVTDSASFLANPNNYANGTIYYNVQSSKFRVYENSVWRDLGGGGGGGGSPGGPNRSIQFNDNGNFGGSGLLLFDSLGVATYRVTLRDTANNISAQLLSQNNAGQVSVWNRAASPVTNTALNGNSLLTSAENFTLLGRISGTGENINLGSNFGKVTVQSDTLELSGTLCIGCGWATSGTTNLDGNVNIITEDNLLFDTQKEFAIFNANALTGRALQMSDFCECIFIDNAGSMSDYTFVQIDTNKIVLNTTGTTEITASVLDINTQGIDIESTGQIFIEFKDSYYQFTSSPGGVYTELVVDNLNSPDSTTINGRFIATNAITGDYAGLAFQSDDNGVSEVRIGAGFSDFSSSLWSAAGFNFYYDGLGFTDAATYEVGINQTPLNYSSDASINYTDRSFTDKEYVDNAVSDSRLKSNVQPIKNATAIIKKLNPVTFEMKGEKQSGFIAQEIEKVLPDMVKKPKRENQYYKVKRDYLEAYAIAAIQELTKRVERLERENAKLRKQSNQKPNERRAEN